MSAAIQPRTESIACDNVEEAPETIADLPINMKNPRRYPNAKRDARRSSRYLHKICPISKTNRVWYGLRLSAVAV